MEFGPRKLGSEHIMKVDPRAQSSRDVQPVTAEEVRSAPKPAEPAADAVKLSDALKLADGAVRAAAVSGDVRPEAVARARQLMESGQLGSNAEALADRIIDSLLESRDTHT
jgi:anti-sigma28 factor (negative regulator of flagellin synthesis)